MSDLKPCPFCGSKRVKAYVYHDAVYRQYAVRCGKCGARIMKASTELAIEAWNSRVEPERKTGKWVHKPNEYDDDTYECSQCGEPWTLIEGTPKENNMNFCPNCGADMTRGE